MSVVLSRQPAGSISWPPAPISKSKPEGGQAMRSVALGLAPAKHDIAVAATMLRGLGMAADEALAVARRPLPEFPMVR